MQSHNATNRLRWVGAVLLIIGTSIGGGMLALPIATAQMGFIPSVVYLILTWLLMTFGALLILEVNAWLPNSSNLISMAGQTIGRWGQALAWLAYLLLLYSLLSAYIAAGQDVVSTIFGYLGFHLTMTTAVFIFIIIFSLIVYSGIRHVDWVNRLIMLVKLFTYLGLVGFSFTFIHVDLTIPGMHHFSIMLSTAMIMITSYGFAIIVPSLRTYLNNDISKLRSAVLIGSLFPLIFYILWECVIFNALPATGPFSLQTLASSSEPIATLMKTLSHLSHYSFLVLFANIFTSVCVFTAFLGVSLCLLDFLADGLRVKKKGWWGIVLYFATFLPPLLLVLFAQKVFIYGLSYAGVCCVFLLILLPAWMAWMGRYKRNFPTHYRVWGGKCLLLILILVSLVLLALQIVMRF